MPNIITANLTAQGVTAKTATDAGQVLTFTRVAVGSGTAADSFNITQLVDFQMNLTPAPPQVVVNTVQQGQSLVLATLDSINAPTTPFHLTEIGVFATIAGSQEFLYAYFQLDTSINGGDIIQFQTGLTRTVINMQLPTVIGIGAVLANTILPGSPIYVPAVKSPDGTVQVTTPVDSSGRVIEWDLSVGKNVIQAITQPVTLYVSPGGNDTTAQPNNPNLPWATPQAAHDSLLSNFINPGTLVTIQLLAGTFPLTQSLCIDHPQSNQILLIGTIGGIGNISHVAIPSGSTVKVTVDSSFGINVGDWVLVIGPNPNQPQATGIFQCTAVTSTTVSYTATASFSVNPSDLNGCTIRSLKSVLNVTVGNGTIGVETGNNVGSGGRCTGGLGMSVQNLAIVGANLFGLGLLAGPATNVSAQFVGVTNFSSKQSVGFSAQGSTLILKNCAAYVKGDCIQSQAAANVSASFCSFSGNSFPLGAAACVAAFASSLSLFSCFVFNNYTGVEATSGGSVTIGGNSWINFNNVGGAGGGGGGGIFANSGGTVSISGSTTVNNNLPFDINPFTLACIQRSAGSLFYSTSSITPNQLSANGSIFQP